MGLFLHEHVEHLRIRQARLLLLCIIRQGKFDLSAEYGGDFFGVRGMRLGLGNNLVFLVNCNEDGTI